MTTSNVPPEVGTQLAALRRAVYDLQRDIGGRARTLGDLDDVVAVGGGDGVMLGYSAPRGLWLPGHLFWGPGAPPGTGVSGDYWFRSDTPGTANQRIYVSNGAAWAGVV